MVCDNNERIRVFDINQKPKQKRKTITATNFDPFLISFLVLHWIVQLFAVCLSAISLLFGGERLHPQVFICPHSQKRHSNSMYLLLHQPLSHPCPLSPCLSPHLSFSHSFFPVQTAIIFNSLLVALLGSFSFTVLVEMDFLLYSLTIMLGTVPSPALLFPPPPPSFSHLPSLTLSLKSMARG